MIKKSIKTKKNSFKILIYYLKKEKRDFFLLITKQLN